MLSLVIFTEKSKVFDKERVGSYVRCEPVWGAGFWPVVDIDFGCIEA